MPKQTSPDGGLYADKINGCSVILGNHVTVYVQLAAPFCDSLLSNCMEIK